MARTRTELAVLGLLGHVGPASGYDLRKHVEASVGFIWTPTRSQLYAVLPRLSAAGLTTAEHVAQSTRPDKQLHALTSAGRAAVHDWLTRVDPIEPEDRDAVLLKVHFAAQAPPGAIAAQLRDFRARSAERLATYEAIAATPAPADPHPRMTLALGIRLVQAGVAWADEVLERLDDGVHDGRS